MISCSRALELDGQFQNGEVELQGREAEQNWAPRERADFGEETESFGGNYQLPDRNVLLMPLMFIPEPGSKHIRNATKDSPLDSSVSASVESSTLGPSCLFTSVISQVDGGKQEAVSYFSRSAFW